LLAKTKEIETKPNFDYASKASLTVVGGNFIRKDFFLQ